MHAPLCEQSVLQVLVVCSVRGHLRGGTSAPFLEGTPESPLHRFAKGPRHRAALEHCVHLLACLVHRLELGIDGVMVLGEVFLEIERLRLKGTRKFQRLGLADVQDIVDGTEGLQRYRAVTQPVEQVRHAVAGREAALVVNANIPAKTVAREALCESTDGVVMLEQQNAVSRARVRHRLTCRPCLTG